MVRRKRREVTNQVCGRLIKNSLNRDIIKQRVNFTESKKMQESAYNKVKKETDKAYKVRAYKGVTKDLTKDISAINVSFG